MAPSKDTYQDDYYSQVKATQSSDDTEKKPLKLKLKVVSKKSAENEEESVEAPKAETPSEKKPQARLVEREHASEGLLRSVMSRNTPVSDTPVKEERKKPAISFDTKSPQIKVLENRPVMQLPPEERRRFPPRNGQNRPFTERPHRETSTGGDASRAPS